MHWRYELPALRWHQWPGQERREKAAGIKRVLCRGQATEGALWKAAPPATRWQCGRGVPAAVSSNAMRLQAAVVDNTRKVHHSLPKPKHVEPRILLNVVLGGAGRVRDHQSRCLSMMASLRHRGCARHVAAAGSRLHERDPASRGSASVQRHYGTSERSYPTWQCYSASVLPSVPELQAGKDSNHGGGTTKMCRRTRA